MRPEQERVKAVLVDTIALLCKNGLSYDRELKIQAVIGVTVDEDDVFLVHINESFNPPGASSTTATSSEMSSALVPFHANAQHVKTPSSGVKRMKMDSTSGMSPSTDAARHHAKQQLRFASPAKSPVAAAGAQGVPPVRAPGRVNSVLQAGGIRRGAVSARRGSGVRGVRRGVMGRGSVPGRSQLRGGMTRAGQSQLRHPATFVPGPQPSTDQPGNQSTSYDMKFSPARGSSSATEMPRPGTNQLPRGAAESPVGYNFGGFPSTFSSAGGGSTGIGAFSASDPERFVNTVPPGFGFEGLLAPDSSSSSGGGGIQTGSFADINPSLEFGFPSGFEASNDGNSFMRSAGSVNAGDIKTESLDDDVIFVDEENTGKSAAASGSDGPLGFENSSDVGDGAGAAVQQITRRVTITTNIQGQNVKYEQV